MKKKKIAIFAVGWGSVILYQYLKGLQKAFKGKNIDMFLFLNYALVEDTSRNQRGELNIFRLPDIGQFDGVIIFANSIDYPNECERILNECRHHNIPVVTHGVVYKNAYSVVSDNYVGMKALVEHLITEHGVKRICYISGAHDNGDANIRMKAISDTLEEHGLHLSDDDVVFTNWEVIRGYNYVTKSVKDNNLADAYVCANDELAMGICLALEACNVKVPDDVIVTGFDNLMEAKVFHPSIASVDQGFEEHGVESANIILDIIDGKQRDDITSIPCEFLESESCGCGNEELSRKLRERAGTDAYSKSISNILDQRHMHDISRSILSCFTYSQIKRKLTSNYDTHHPLEGDTFHFMLDPDKLRADLGNEENTEHQFDSGFSETLDIIYSIKDGERLDGTKLYTRDLIPGYDENDSERLYVFAPLRIREQAIGYLVFTNCYEEINDRSLFSYYDNINVSMEKFVQNQYLQYVNKKLTELSYTDSLTHVRNRAAYEEREKELEEEIAAGAGTEFGMIMFDLNNLKQINDVYGHSAGDAYITNSCDFICSIFKFSPIYRMGGDEFLIILEGNDYEHRDELYQKFGSELAKFAANKEGKEPASVISIASGMAVYDSSIDKSVEDVNKRADNLMYENKKAMKKAMNQDR